MGGKRLDPTTRELQGLGISTRSFERALQETNARTIAAGKDHPIARRPALRDRIMKYSPADVEEALDISEGQAFNAGALLGLSATYVTALAHYYTDIGAMEGWDLSESGSTFRPRFSRNKRRPVPGYEKFHRTSSRSSYSLRSTINSVARNPVIRAVIILIAMATSAAVGWLL